MNAVVTKPRASTAKTAPAPRARTLSDVHDDLAQVSKLLETAYAAAPTGDSLSELLHHIINDILPAAVKPICDGKPTQADAQATYDALFTPLACLDSATALAATSALHPTLSQAYTLLDNIQTELDSVGPLGASLPRAPADNWAPLLRAGVSRICALIYAAETFDETYSSGSAARQLLSEAEQVLYFMKSSSDSDLVWSGDPGSAGLLLSVALRLLRQAAASSEVNPKGTNDLQAAILPMALAMVEELLAALAGAPDELDRLVAFPVFLPSAAPAPVDSDLVAFTVMEHIDQTFPTIWEPLPITARANIRNAIVRAVDAHGSSR